MTFKMTIQRNLNIYVLLISSACLFISAKTVDSSADVLSAHDITRIERRLHDAHHEKLQIIQECDTKGHFGRVMACHEKISAIETYGTPKPTKTFNPDECTTAKCQIMRLIHQISFNIQALMRLIAPEHRTKLQELNQEIHELKVLLKKYGIEDKTFDKHPISVYL